MKNSSKIKKIADCFYELEGSALADAKAITTHYRL
jgi:hypothetical protein